MTEFDTSVDRQRILLKAEKWANTPKCVHIHSLQSMWYDDRPEDTADGQSVTDVQYNSGLITRMKDGTIIHTWGEAKSGDDLIWAYQHEG